MSLEQFTRNEGQVARRFQYDDAVVFAVDFGASEPEASVDLVDETVIVVIGEDQYEFELPETADEAHTFIKNGVLTVELEGDL
ncbi:DUF7127 family protein [Natronorubrum daqingense]|uniref:Hsp20/alpha crystallin family protein n=1 Tax=Natronorubrum daqingense TaxID=588898 RepID=A0A1N7EAW9_9EURY|nr:hypothetical protein [Natronorubrum daqingense]APX96465.1 hypothetical protein BB347_07455 [Natronorubrum daqingense]SIR85272.1 hypothetical protein SAMN05421809_2582 [Natronorubrum daqingense]